MSESEKAEEEESDGAIAESKLNKARDAKAYEVSKDGICDKILSFVALPNPCAKKS